jgi:pyridoxine 5-phosphate synthase
MPKLGVNIDHVATLRQARGGFEPDPLEAARICEGAGADSIVAHLREDRRHIQDADIRKLRKIVTTKFNLEMSLNPTIVRIAITVQPHQATLVPENRREITTEGGLDVQRHFERVRSVVQKLHDKGITVSLFIDPIKKQIVKSKGTGAEAIELHTGGYANAKSKKTRAQELKKLKDMAQLAQRLGLLVHAGHGLNYQNVRPVARIPGIEELNIGHSIISHSVFTGLPHAVEKMKTLIRNSY